jgi:hypothetical protein
MQVLEALMKRGLGAKTGYFGWRPSKAPYAWQLIQALDFVSQGQDRYRAQVRIQTTDCLILQLPSLQID